MVFPNRIRLEQPLMNSVFQWVGVVFASLAFFFPMVWFISVDAAAWVGRAMFVLFLLGIGRKALPIYRDRVVQLCALLTLVVVIGYIWQCFSVPEELFNGSSARKFITAFCFFVVVAYGINATPRVSPFLLLISAGAGLLVHLWLVPTDVWLSGWRGKRMAFCFQNEGHAGVIVAAALLASVLFLPRISSLPSRVRILVLPLLVSFILLMMFCVIATNTRAVWLGLLLSAIFLFLVYAVALLTGHCSLRWRTLIRAATIGTGILLAGSVMIYFMGGSIIQRLSEETVDVATIKEMVQLKTTPRSSVGVRVGSWVAAREWIAERPVFGWGGDSASKLIKQSPHFDEDFKNSYGHLHNSYLETMVGVGGAAVVCMIAIAFLVAWRIVVAWHHRRMSTDVFLFSCTFFPFWVTVNIFESYIAFKSGAFLNAVIGGVVYSWYLRSQYDQFDPERDRTPPAIRNVKHTAP